MSSRALAIGDGGAWCAVVVVREEVATTDFDSLASSCGFFAAAIVVGLSEVGATDLEGITFVFSTTGFAAANFLVGAGLDFLPVIEGLAIRVAEVALFFATVFLAVTGLVAVFLAGALFFATGFLTATIFLAGPFGAALLAAFLTGLAIIFAAGFLTAAFVAGFLAFALSDFLAAVAFAATRCGDDVFLVGFFAGAAFVVFAIMLYPLSFFIGLPVRRPYPGRVGPFPPESASVL